MPTSRSNDPEAAPIEISDIVYRAWVGRLLLFGPQQFLLGVKKELDLNLVRFVQGPR